MTQFDVQLYLSANTKVCLSYLGLRRYYLLNNAWFNNNN